jgi:hypothetical protein
MKVKTFLGSDAEEVDRQVNAWLAKSKVHVRRTSTAFKCLKFRGEGTLAGTPVIRHGAVDRSSAVSPLPPSRTPPTSLPSTGLNAWKTQKPLVAFFKGTAPESRW